jgi:hypothetical protein
MCVYLWNKFYEFLKHKSTILNMFFWKECSGALFRRKVTQPCATAVEKTVFPDPPPHLALLRFGASTSSSHRLEQRNSVLPGSSSSDPLYCSWAVGTVGCRSPDRTRILSLVRKPYLPLIVVHFAVNSALNNQIQSGPPLSGTTSGPSGQLLHFAELARV